MGSNERRDEVIKNVILSMYNNYNGEDKDVLIADSITRGELISRLQSGAIMFHGISLQTANDVFSGVPTGSELFIKYTYEGKEGFASFCNKTSDVSDEWFSFGCRDEVVERSILDGEDYAMKYNDEKLLAEDKGVKLTQNEYIEKSNKAPFNAAVIMGGD